MVVRKMKEKCKDAARMRREKERAEFVELSKLLPLPSSTTSQLDKASIIRLTSSYLRMRAAFPQGLGGNWGNDYHHHHRGLKQAGRFQQQRQHESPPNNHGQSSSDILIQQQQQQPVKELGSLILQTLDGFVFALHNDGKIMYISETASVHLGLPQIDLTGSSVFEYVHPSDHNDIYEILSINEAEKTLLNSLATNSTLDNSTYELGRSFCMRMKCILPKRNAGLVSSGYKAIHCNGYLKVRRINPYNNDNNNNNNSDNSHATSGSNNVKGSGNTIVADGNCSSVTSGGSKLSAAEQTSSSLINANNDNNNLECKISSQEEWESYALVAVGHSLLPTASTEVKLTGNSFMFRANLDLKLYYIEPSITKLLGFEQIELIGQSLYQLIHVNDLLNLENSHRSLLEKGQVVTKYYRLMKKSGSSIWIQSYATLVNNPRNMPKPQHIVDNSIYSTSGKSCNNSNNGITMAGITTTKVSVQKLHKQKVQQKKNFAPIKECRKTNIITKINANKSSKLASNASSLVGNYLISQQQQQHDDSKSTCSSNGSSNRNSISRNDGGGGLFIGQQTTNNLCACTLPNYIQTNSNITSGQQQGNNFNSIGSLRRPSDDSCSVVSSVASTSLSSNCSLHHTNSDSFLGYTLASGGDTTINYTSDHVMGQNTTLINYPPTLDSPIKSSASISSIPDQQTQASSSSSSTTTTTNSISYDNFNISQNKIHTQQQQPVTLENGAISMSPVGHQINAISSQAWLTPKTTTRISISNELPSTQLSQVVDNQLIGYNNQQPTHYQFQSSPDWLTQANCSSHIFNDELRSQHVSNFSTSSGNYHFSLDESHSTNYGETQISTFHYPTSPTYLSGTDNNVPQLIHYQQQVPVNNGYTM